MNVSHRDCEKVFRVLKIVEKRSKHHVRGVFYFENKAVLTAFYSFGRKDMPGFVGEKFRKSLYLNKKQFKDLLDGKFGYDQFVESLREKGVIN